MKQVETDYNLLPQEVSYLELKPLVKAYTRTMRTKLYPEEGVKKHVALKQSKADFMAEQIRKKEALKHAEQAFEINYENEMKNIKLEGSMVVNRFHRDECTEHIESWNGTAAATLAYTTGAKLPLEIWELVLMAVCNDIDPEGVRGPSVVARDLMNASFTCKELYNASQPAFQHLSTFCEVMPHGTDELWTTFVSDPTALRLDEIRTLAKATSIKISQPRSALIIELMNTLKLHKPSRIPAKVLKAVLREKGGVVTILNRVLYSKAEKLNLSRSQIQNLFRLRMHLTEEGLLSMDHLISAGVITESDIDKARARQEKSYVYK